MVSEGQLLLPVSIQNFEHVTMSFETEHLSSFDVISEGFQKYLIYWDYKPTLHTLSKVSNPDKRIWTRIDDYPNTTNSWSRILNEKFNS